ncbi:transglycosylase domain-containing protein [Listeria fleischmannii]|uniref:Penicillin-binding protein 1A n=1 Tax=Listeria fleischmannii TaxID=1069827 RepID=A0A841YH62_9LIST|nr:penicillin-binding protein 1A [Listeria fleischmannii]EIA20240.1 penicillin-binding protein [Listeria fleischmannii subsp. coloradonensis]MBC1399619.1 penicillin-binding protein 1A [Listeria fleischmannii]MBC1427868.1 penicillin-binding protein 1A [Listeria fleischmannii]STY35502.1 Penicillin-binding protein 1A/1B [Listeria fleischmannii subsp. coloradonensis]
MAEKPQTRSEYRSKKTNASQKKPKRNLTKNIFKSIFFVALFLVFFGIAAGASLFYVYAKDAPELTDSKLRDPLSSKLLDKDGKVFAEIGTERREYIEYKDIPKQLENAILATEDSRFYSHDGLDPIRLGGAVLANVKNGFGAEGASTLSQQIIKMSYLDYTNKTLARKAQEAYLALQLEEKYSKHDIIEIYVNKVYMSDRVHGMETAAEHYFGKNLKDLNLSETALIAGMPQSPNNYNPYDYPDLAKKRRDLVLKNMYNHDKITKQEMEEAQSQPISKGLRSKEDREDKTYKYDAYVTQVLNEIPEEYDVYSDGLTIYTALDQDAQQYTEKMLNTNDIVQFSDDKMQAGIVLQDTTNGRVQAIGGSRNQAENVTRGYNYATQLKRQVGSTMKPIADYGPAFEYLNWSTAQILDDEPYTYSGGNKINNWDFGYKGPITLRQALYQSRNIPALKTLQAVGLDKAKAFTNGLGFNYKDFYESYAIGANESNPLQMAGAYAAFGNQGMYTKPHTVTKIVLSDGSTTMDMEPKSEVAMKESTAYMVSDVLKDVLSVGTGTSAAVPGVPVAGKTGTTNFDEAAQNKYLYPNGAARDAWFAGYSTNYTIAVWTGYDSLKNYLSADEQKISQRMFSSLMSHVSANKETADFKAPSNVVSVPILKGSNPPVRAGSGTPSSQVSMELFLAGTVPSKAASSTTEKKTKEDDKSKEEAEAAKKKAEEEKKKAEEEKRKQEEAEKNKPLSAPTGLSASYNATTKQVSASWGAVEGATYEVTVNGQKSTVTTTSITVAGMTPGSTVTISVVAVKDGKTSGAATTTVPIPAETNANDNATGNNGQNQNGNNNPENNNGQSGNGDPPSPDTAE